MSISNLQWALSLAVVVILAAYLSIEISSAVDSNDREGLRMQERQLLEERCSGPEAVNRQYLQQSWFHSPEFREIAVSFGRRITPSGGDTLQIRKLSENVLTIAFESSGKETTFYRKR